jgi:hypothetical protein
MDIGHNIYNIPKLCYVLMKDMNEDISLMASSDVHNFMVYDLEDVICVAIENILTLSNGNW